MTKSASFFMALVLAGAGATLMTAAQTPIAVRYTATTDNVGMRDSIRMELFRWSSDEERQQLLAAWNVPAATAAAPPAPAAPAAPAATAPEPAAAAAAGGDNAAPAPAGRGAGGRGGAGAGAARGGGGNAQAGAPARGAGGNARGGAPARGAAGNARGGAPRGGARGDAAAGNAATLTPEDSLGSALGKAPSVGRLWSSEAAGYSVRYAVRLPQPDGGERIVLITDRRLSPDFWKPAGTGAVTNYTFSVIELRLDSKGQGEGKASLTSKVNVDATAKTYALEDYAASTVIFRSVERH